MKRKNITGIITVVVLFVAVTSVSFGKTQEKKLINFGWDLKSPSQLSEVIDDLQDLPFDGLTIRAAWCYPFYSKGLGNGDSRLEIVKNIKWGRYTDNFMYLTAGANVDWFDDKVWADDGEIMKNIRAIAKIGGAAGCKGIMFEPEFFYWGLPGGPWEYATQKQKSKYTYAQFEVKIRQRGAAIINAIEEYMPDTAFLTCFWGSGDMYSETNGSYGLLSAFMCGILDEADPGTRVIDGNENSYYCTTRKEYEDFRRITKVDNLAIIPQDLKRKHRRQVQTGFAIFEDQISNNRPFHITSTYMTPDERAKYMEHNVYWALKTSEEYVWFYTEIPHYLRHKGIAPGMIPAINRARKKVALGKPLGFNIDDIQNRAWAACIAAEHAAIPTETANVKSTVSPPKINGKLGKNEWTGAVELGPFKSFAVSPKKEVVKTTALMTYDRQNLYIAFACDEPDVINPSNMEGDGAPDRNGYVRIAIAADEPATKYYHIVLAPDGKRWDSLTKAEAEQYGTNSSWTGEFTHAAFMGDKSWSTEIAIPWKTLGRRAPKPGDTIKGNLNRWRHRDSSGQMQGTSWSQERISRAVEAEQFGTWTFE